MATAKSSQHQDPTAVLEARAALVAAQSGGVVSAEVRGEHDLSDQKRVDNFYLVAPNLGYRYLLLTVQFPPEFYPARVGFSGWPEQWREVADEAELVAQLDEIFAHEKTRMVVEAIEARS